VARVRWPVNPVGSMRGWHPEATAEEAAECVNLVMPPFGGGGKGEVGHRARCQLC
jgi:hypothetical protein